eukprot:CAMPEP_0184688214 /NCGR_PEP_ID=MMETSP0312-20130426/28981_1 /TAXON_ID=31354 /ORGANISM="Compsopogon coeruleus, Strain SAG 36.94" /LENGTH=61 /DNA_ID=CAMNT_0027145101 /DNA_START=495 /DNA_END=680 /DNA_ORIENTATION=-
MSLDENSVPETWSYGEMGAIHCTEFFAVDADTDAVKDFAESRTWDKPMGNSSQNSLPIDQL